MDKIETQCPDSRGSAPGAGSASLAQCPYCGAPKSFDDRNKDGPTRGYDCRTMWFARGACDISRGCLVRQTQQLHRAGYVLAMRLLQSSITPDDEERAAMERFLPAPPQKPNAEGQ